MTPSRTGGDRGHYQIDRIFPGLDPDKKKCRVKRSIRSSSEKRHARVDGILSKLFEAGQLEIIRAFRDHELSPEALLEMDRGETTTATVASLKLRERLWDREVTTRGRVEVEPGAVSRALTKVKGARTRERYATSWAALLQKGARYLGPTATVGALAGVPWEELYASWGASNTDWMHLRRAVSRTLSLILGRKHHPFRHEVMDALPAKREKKRRPKLTPEAFTAILAHAPPHAVVSYWVLVATGMRVGEYLSCRPEHLHRATYELDVPGTKTDESAAPLTVDPAWWGYLEQGIPARLGYQWLHRYWMRACVAADVGRLVEHPKGTRRWQEWLRPELRPVKRAPAGVAPAVHAAREAEKRAALARLPLLRYQGPTIHDLRHCHGQWAIDAGVREAHVQDSLRHSSPDQTRDYTRRGATLEVSSALAARLLPPSAGPAPSRRPA